MPCTILLSVLQLDASGKEKDELTLIVRKTSNAALKFGVDVSLPCYFHNFPNFIRERCFQFVFCFFRSFPAINSECGQFSTIASAIKYTEKCIWTSRNLHDLIECIDMLKEHAETKQIVDEFDLAKKETILHRIDPAHKYDMHKMINQLTGENGYPEKPQFFGPSEMAVARSTMSGKTTSLMNRMTIKLSNSEPVSRQAQLCIDQLLSEIRHQIDIHRKNIIELNMKSSAEKEKIEEKIKISFDAFVRRITADNHQIIITAPKLNQSSQTISGKG